MIFDIFSINQKNDHPVTTFIEIDSKWNYLKISAVFIQYETVLGSLADIRTVMMGTWCVQEKYMMHARQEHDANKIRTRCVQAKNMLLTRQEHYAYKTRTYDA